MFSKQIFGCLFKGGKVRMSLKIYVYHVVSDWTELWTQGFLTNVHTSSGLSHRNRSSDETDG